MVCSGVYPRACDNLCAVLALSPDDADALACKRTLLIKQGAYGEALKMCPADGSAHLFERAYCLFRQGHLAEALALLDAQQAALATGQPGALVRGWWR